jgi:hypothetical protein
LSSNERRIEAITQVILIAVYSLLLLPVLLCLNVSGKCAFEYMEYSNNPSWLLGKLE